jgi:hypothetical protein
MEQRLNGINLPQADPRRLSSQCELCTSGAIHPKPNFLEPDSGHDKGAAQHRKRTTTSFIIYYAGWKAERGLGSTYPKWRFPSTRRRTAQISVGAAFVVLAIGGAFTPVTMSP